MSTFDYAEAASSGMGEGADAAQEFLQDKLNKQVAKSGRYSATEMKNLLSNGGAAVVNSSDGKTGVGGAYDSQNVDALPDLEVGGPGALADGKLTAEQIRDRFGLTYNEEHVKGSKTHPNGSNEQTNAIYQRDTGEYIGTMTGSVDSYQRMADYAKEQGWPGVNRFNSVNDVASAASSILGEGKDPEIGADKTRKKIEHSDEAKQAINRVRTYENDVFSGKMSNDIFGSAEDYSFSGDTGGGSADYSFDHNKGGSGIGTSGGLAVDDSSTKASASFLNSKKADVKKEFNFVPVS